MDQLIVSIILAVIVAIVLSRVLSGVLRLVAIAAVSLVLIIVSAKISDSSSLWPQIFNRVDSSDSTAVVEGIGGSGGASSINEDGNSVSSATRESSDGAFDDTGLSSNSDFAGVSAATGSPQDLNSAQPPSGASFPSEQSNGLQPENVTPEGNQDSPATNYRFPPDSTSQPINALW